ncbi:MAG TPA: hypothetical protein VIC51_12900 [Psychromonas sp.]
MAQIENILLPGAESEESIDILIGLTGMRSDAMRKALIFHFVNGAADVYCYAISGVSASNFTRDVKKLNKVAREIDKYLELNYRK